MICHLRQHLLLGV